MNRRVTSVLGVTAAASIAAVALQVAPAGAAPSTTGETQPTRAGSAKAPQDNKPDPLAAAKSNLQQKAVDQLATGKAKTVGKGKDRKIKMADGRLVSYPVTQTSQLLTFLVEFGDENTNSALEDSAMPHNSIPEPAADDNSTYWVDDFSSDHFKDMFFGEGESFKDAYREMSSGRFDLEGDVSDWVQVPKTSASYQGDGLDHNGDGRPDSALGDETAQGMTDFVQDTADAWYESQIAAGKTKAEIAEYLKSFDIWDRYDIDGDGNQNESDGYIDHFQAVHSGEGEEAGAPLQTIWSHRWAVNQGGVNVDGPRPGDYDASYPLGGIQIGDTNLWIRDYTTEPENGGLGVFAHEFGHDLGLPDFYDTAGGENSTAYWTLMSAGSWLGHGDGAIGTTPNHMGPAEKMFLGWYGENDLAVVDAADEADLKLGPSYHATTLGKQAATVALPDGQTEMSVGAAPAYGSRYLYTGRGDDRDAFATTPSFTVPANGSLTAKVNYAIELDWDYLFVTVSKDGGKTFVPLNTNLSTTADPNGQNIGYGITGSSKGQWVDLTADLSAYAGQNVQVRFHNYNDAATNEMGAAIDEVAVGSALQEGFEDGTGGWTIDQMYDATNGTYPVSYSHYYMVENRTYQGYDKVLKTGPYNFGWMNSAPNTVEHFPYQDGMLVWYRTTLYGDNNTSAHPGYGQALPVDANGATPLTWSNGTFARPRIQAFDSTFDVDKTDGLDLSFDFMDPKTGALISSETLKAPSTKSTAVFDDSDVNAYWSPDLPGASTKVGGTGTVIKVLSSNEKKGQMNIEVTRK